MRAWSLVEAVAAMAQVGQRSPRKASGRGFRGASRLGLTSIKNRSWSSRRGAEAGRGRDRSAAARKGWLSRKRG
jgi:hypothetical protein